MEIAHKAVVKKQKGTKVSAEEHWENVQSHTVDTKVITMEHFKVINGLLDLDHTENDVEIIFSNLNKIMRDYIEYPEYVNGIRRGQFLKNVVKDGAAIAPYILSSSYEWEKSTNHNYMNPDTTQFVGEFIKYREVLDYNYHVNYIPARQLWQDQVIKSVVVRTQPQTQPWIVYTCGPMGAGKGYALSWMSENGCFPLESIVHIDPDHFKSCMSEWSLYVAQSKKNPAIEPGTLCHKESGFIQEIAQEVFL